jgi:hypothetical protein
MSFTTGAVDTAMDDDSHDYLGDAGIPKLKKKYAEVENSSQTQLTGIANTNTAKYSCSSSSSDSEDEVNLA